MGSATTRESALRESNAGQNRARGRSEISSWICLAIAGILLLFANGRDNIALAAWLAPIFLLRFVRRQRAAIGLPVAYLLILAIFPFQFRGMVPIPGAAYYVFIIAFGVLLALPFAIDRMVTPRLGGLAATFVFPAAWVAVEYCYSRGPYGTWGNVPYTQYGNLPLLQVLCVTGMWGVTFMIGWFAASCNQVWKEGFDCRPARRALMFCIATILGVMFVGGARLAFFPPSSPTVRVASLSKRKVDPEPSEAALNRLFQDKATAADIEIIQRWSDAMDDDLLTRAESEMQTGAKIVFWGEANAPVFKDQEAQFLARGSALAKKYGVYLGMAVGVWTPGHKPPFENKLILIEPDGQIAWMYDKARPVPGGEAALQVRGDGLLKAVDTPYGRVSGIICFDGDFPQLVAQAGALRADIVLDPANDWRPIDPWHTQMASFRAIEQGMNLVRQTSLGLSAAYDYQGRRISATDYYSTADYAMVSEVPTRGTRTFYSRAGDWFAWLSIAALLWLIVRAWMRRRSVR